jgi:meiotically up-regulated gene 157 (Mug157) protein
LTDRRGFVSAAAAAFVTPAIASGRVSLSPANGRPPPAARAFASPAVEAAIAQLQRKLGSKGIRGKLARMAGQCIPNTLDTTVQLGSAGGRPDTFVLTGDIPAMWLRDSTAQVWPYLQFAKDDPRLALLLRGVVERQTRCVLIDPYANAFSRDLVPSPEHMDDETQMSPGVFERKWELDSLCSVIRFADGYWRATGDRAPFDARWHEAMRLVLSTLRTQQRKRGPGPYYFQRRTSWNPDSVPGDGFGNPMRPVGLVVSLFRPSDDAAVFPFPIAANAYAALMLRRLATLCRSLSGDTALLLECRLLAQEIETALELHGTATHPRHGRVWAYEVDGFGNALFMDDANVPSLLSLPYLGWRDARDPIYRRTRALVLGDDDPWFHRGRAGEGIGSPHTPGRRVWPIASTMQALTSTSDAEIARCLRMLATTDGGTGFMHEAFDVDDPRIFSRSWFAWANSLFGELMLRVVRNRPRVLDLLGD